MNQSLFKAVVFLFAGATSLKANANFQCDYHYSVDNRSYRAVVRMENLLGKKGLVIREPNSPPGYNDKMVDAYQVIKEEPGQVTAERIVEEIGLHMRVVVKFPPSGTGPGSITYGEIVGGVFKAKETNPLHNCKPWQEGLSGQYHAL